MTAALWGTDDWFPFAPFRMYATTSDPNGAIRVLALDARIAGEWTSVPLNSATVGINRAELEGSWSRIQRNPEMLEELAHTHSKLRPTAPRWEAVRVVERRQQLRESRPIGDMSRRVLLEWELE